jgi:hypothetical protein
MKKTALGKIFIAAILALGLVYVPMSHNPVQASASQEGYQKISAARLHRHNLKAAKDKGIFMLRREGNQTICNDATVTEMQELKNSEQDVPMHVLNPQGEIVTQAVNGLTLTLRGTQQLEANPQAKAAYIRAAETWMSIIKSPITVVIDVDFGTTRFGTPYEANVLGATNSQVVGANGIYPDVRNSLLGGALDAQQLSVSNAAPVNGVPTTISNTAATRVDSPATVFRALGFLDPVAAPAEEAEDIGNPPRIGFNSAFDYDFDPSDGIGATKIDFTGIALHEIGHALGFSSEVGFKELQPDAGLSLSTWDLFRFRPGTTLATIPTAQRVLSSGGNQVFYAGGQELQLATGRPDGSGGDGDQASHWKDDQLTGNTIGLMDPSARDGQLLSISQNDRNAMAFFGHLVGPLPGLAGDTLVLTSDIPQFNSIVAPAGEGACVLSGLQFTINVPAGATQLKIVVNGNQDADLFARFNQRVAVQGTTLLADFRSDSEFGNETIIITPATSPALQSGIYFIGVSNCGPGVTPFNITATVSSGGGTSPVVLRSATFDPTAPVMVVKATGLISPADLEINGVIVTPPLKVKVKSEAKAKIVATAAELGLHAGANTIRLRINGLFTNAVTLNQ